MKDYREILVWQRSRALTLEICRLSTGFPQEKLSGSQGTGPKRFMGIPLGSACELDYQLQPATDLGHLGKEDASRVSGEILEIRRMLGGFIQKLQA